MSEFTQPGLKLDFKEATGRRAILLEEILYEIGHEGSGNWLIVPAGFDSDGASVPRPLWSILPPWGSKASKAALVHDYLLVRLYSGRPWPGFEKRKAIDDEFLIAMKAIGVDPILARLVHAGVRSWSTLKGSIASFGLS